MIIRPVTDGDRGLIYNSWLKSFRSSHGSGPIRDKEYYDAYRHAIDELIARPGFCWAVADVLEDGRHIAGWLAWLDPGRHDHWNEETKRTEICGAPAILYCYVKAPYRQARKRALMPVGVATSLLAHAKIDPRQRWCFAYWTPTLQLLIAGERDKKTGDMTSAKWPGGNYDTHFCRHLR